MRSGGGISGSPWPLVVGPKHVSKRPQQLETFAAEGEVRSHDHRVADPRAEPDSSSGLEVSEIEVPSARHDFAGVGEECEVEATKDVPAMLGAEDQRLVVAEALAREAAQ